jgi:hypothetical protein
VRGALPSAEAQVVALTAALSARYPRLRCEWAGGRLVRLVLGRAGVAIAVDLVVLAPVDALAAELGAHLAVLTGRPIGPTRGRRAVGGGDRRRERRLVPRPASQRPGREGGHLAPETIDSNVLGGTACPT